MGKIGDVVSVLEVVAEGKGVVAATLAHLDIIFVVADVLAPTSPAILVRPATIGHLHPALKGRVALGQVEYMEPYPSP